MPLPPEIVILPGPVDLAEEAARRFVALAREAIADHGRFTVALAGGATPAALYRRLAEAPVRQQVDWAAVRVYFGDERCVPPDHLDSNYRMARETLLDAVQIPAANVQRIPGELSPRAAARQYRLALRHDFALRGHGRPRFDLILLGLGADGHTASLFPGSPALGEQFRAAVAAPTPTTAQPAVPRVTLALPVLNAAAAVWFLVTGENKAAAVQEALGQRVGSEPSPARRVQPAAGRLLWLLDRGAARNLILNRRS
jgi:6-phosphogluconolactonase